MSKQKTTIFFFLFSLLAGLLLANPSFSLHSEHLEETTKLYFKANSQPCPIKSIEHQDINSSIEEVIKEKMGATRTFLKHSHSVTRVLCIQVLKISTIIQPKIWADGHLFTHAP